MYKTIVYRCEENVAWIILNQPDALNEINHQVLHELNIVLDEVRDRDEIRAVVISGEGRAFSAGGNLRSLEQRVNQKGFMRDNMQTPNRIVQKINDMEKPVIAALNGPVAGAACGLVLACDFIIASEKAAFSLPFTRLGLVPELGMHYFLPRIIGLQMAKWLIFTGGKVSATEALELGMVLRVVAHEELITYVTDMATKLAAAPKTSIGMSKRLLNRSLNLDLPAVLEQEGYIQSLCAVHDNSREGVRALLEKRAPIFNTTVE